jgi:DNA-binding protein H-NS
MLSVQQQNAIAPQMEDELTRASIELATHLEDAASSIASHVLPPSFENIRPGLRNAALDVVESFKQSALKALEQTTQMGQLLLRMKADLKRKEYQILLKELGYTSPKANKLIAIAKTFGDFNLWQIASVSINTLFALCSKTYALVVDQMRTSTGLTTEAVEAMMKAARPPRSPKQRQPESTVELARDVSGGGRHLKFQLYDDELVTKITHSAEQEQITNQQAIAIAFRRSEKLSQLQQEHQEAIAEVRERQIEMQRELIKKDKRIDDLEKLLASTSSTALPTVETPTVPYTDNITWEDVAQSVNCDRTLFLDTMKTWAVQQKETLPGLLAEYVETNYPECLDQIGWVPDRLRDAALERLSFAVEKITGAENLVDEPRFECFYRCKFVSLRDFGTRQERWLFEAPDGRKLPVFGRDEFSVNRF